MSRAILFDIRPCDGHTYQLYVSLLPWLRLALASYHCLRPSAAPLSLSMLLPPKPCCSFNQTPQSTTAFSFKFHPCRPQFAQVLFSLQLLLLFPFVRRYVRAASATAHLAFTALTAATTTALLATLGRSDSLAPSTSVQLPLSFLALLAFVCFVCPAWLLSIQKYKAQITGPWDEAVPQIPKELCLPLPEGVAPLRSSS